MKKTVSLYLGFVSLCLVLSGIASAGDDFGIQTYPGAKSDAETQEACSVPEMGIIKEREDSSGLTKTKYCYRTSDPFAKVVEFYKKQKGLEGGVSVYEEDVKSASFCLSETGGCNEVSAGTSVSIGAPWILTKTFKVNNDLLIVITNRVKK